jgi:hypothetical protein
MLGPGRLLASLHAGGFLLAGRGDSQGCPFCEY